MEFRLLNRLDSAIFGRFNPNHVAITGKTFVHTLIGGAIVSLIVFAFQMFSTNHTLIEVIAAIGLLVLLGWVARLSLPNITSFPTWGSRIAYSIYILILSGLAFTIAMWMVMIALVGLVIYGMLKLFFGNGSSSSRSSSTSSTDTKKVDCSHNTISGGCDLNNGWSCHVEKGDDRCPYGVREM